jgi:hypothetical protein
MVEQCLGLRVAEIDRETPLGVIVLYKIGALRGVPILWVSRLEAHCPDPIPSGGELHLDDFGAHFGEQSGAGGAGHDLGEIQYTVASKHRALLHGLGYSAVAGVRPPNRMFQLSPVGFARLCSRRSFRTATPRSTAGRS